MSRKRSKLGAMIAKLRKERGLDQDDIGKACGVHLSAVSHWERGISRPALQHLAALAAVLGVSIDDLVRGAKAA